MVYIGMVVLLGTIVAQPCGVVASGASNKIYNGREAKPNSHPWLVWLAATYNSNDSLVVCGGTLVSDKYVLTAAHCTNVSYGPLIAIAGDHNRTNPVGIAVAPVKGVVVHPNYDPTSGSYDLALVELTMPMTLSAGIVELAIIAKDELFLQRVYTGNKKCKFAGWGKTESTEYGSTVLQELIVKAVSDDECEAHGYKIVEPNFCWKAKKGRRAPCDGDDGGPIVCRNRGAWEVVGVHVRNPPGDDCTEGIKGAAKTAPVLFWINENIYSN